MNKIVSLLGIVVLLSGCTSAKEKQDAAFAFSNMCDGEVSMDLTLGSYSSKLNLHCDAIDKSQIK